MLKVLYLYEGVWSEFESKDDIGWIIYWVSGWGFKWRISLPITN
jgi:hypothetical protein